MSIFYTREKWHLLLGVIDRELSAMRQEGLAIDKRFVYLSLHRGPSIRLALHFKKVTEKDCRAIERRLGVFLRENPSGVPAVEMPVTSFFMDFPYDEIRYNLFNERYIMNEGMEPVQRLLSDTLLTFFEDHPVDEEGIFNLLLYLLREIIQNMYPDERDRQGFCLQVMRVIQLHLFKLPGEQFANALQHIVF